jgi:hypothetical protein
MNLRIQRWAVGLFFVSFAVTQFLIALPPSFGLAASLAPATRLFEFFGLKQRWSLFTHSPGDQTHGWYQVTHIVKVTDANDRAREWVWPDTSGGFIQRYVRHREFDFVKNLWATKGEYGTAFARDHARRFISENADVRFPLEIEVFQNFVPIPVPLHFKFPGAPTRTLLYRYTITADERVCSKRDKL